MKTAALAFVSVVLLMTACSSDDGGGGGQGSGGTTSVGAAAGSSSVGAAGSIDSSKKPEQGDECVVMSPGSCSDNCIENCGASAACADKCCGNPTKSAGIFCDGSCKTGLTKCELHNENDPACAAAVAVPDEAGCSIEATVQGHHYKVTATGSQKEYKRIECFTDDVGRPLGAGCGMPCDSMCESVKKSFAGCCGK